MSPGLFIQMDFLEHPSISNVIVMGVVLEEVRHRNNSVYQRLRALTLSNTKQFLSSVMSITGVLLLAPWFKPCKCHFVYI